MTAIVFWYHGAVKHFGESWGRGKRDTFPSLILFLCSSGDPRDSHLPTPPTPPPQFLLALPVSSLPAPRTHSRSGSWCRCEFWHLAGEDATGKRRRTDTDPPPALPLLNWDREVVKRSDFCFGEEGKDRVYCRTVLCQYCNIVILKCIILKYNSVLI